MVRPKVQSSSSRAADTGAFAFGAPAFGAGFATASTPFSYLAEAPDISRISDPHTVVIFKNLVKRDATTKARALEDFQSSLSATEAGRPTVETAVLDVWIALYPRLSIDNTRRIRLLAQNVQGLVANAVGKSLAKHLPKIVGPWLLGCHDTDQGVANAAQEGLSRIFVAEKLDALRKVYQSDILQTCLDIIQKESAKTLSDERIVSHEEATAKYDRVVAASLNLLASTIDKLSGDDRSKPREQYEALISDQNIWRFASSKDGPVRRALNRFLRIIIQQADFKSAIDTAFLSTAYVEKALKAEQSSTAADLITTLTSLTTRDPEIWSTNWKGKKAAHVRLREFIKSGSQGGPRSYWQDLSALLAIIPKTGFPTDGESVQQLIEAYQSGISGRAELKTNQVNATVALLQAISPMSSNITNEAECVTVLRNSVFPLLESFILPSEDGKWPSSIESVPVVFQTAIEIPHLASLVSSRWSAITSNVIDMLKKSLPQSSKEYVNSQEKIKETGLRWTLATKAIIINAQTALKIDHTVLPLMRESLTVCESRNGKPYGATVVAQVIYKHLNQAVRQDPDLTKLVDEFLQHSLPSMIVSPSTTSLCALLQNNHDKAYFTTVWNACLDNIASVDHRQTTTQSAFMEILRVAKNTDQSLLNSAAVADLAGKYVQQAIDEGAIWTTVGTILGSLEATESNALLAKMTLALSKHDDSVNNVISGLSTLAKETPTVIERFMKTEDGQRLLTLLLTIVEKHDRESEQAAEELNSLISRLALNNPAKNGSTDGTNRLADVISNGLRNTTVHAVSVDTLANQAISILQSQSTQGLKGLAPDTELWKNELRIFLSNIPSTNLDILNSVPGTSFIVHATVSEDSTTAQISRDADGLSIPLRMAKYTVGILEYSDLFQEDSETIVGVVQLLILTTILANDNLSLNGCNRLWVSTSTIDDGSYADFVASSQQLIAKWASDASQWWLTGQHSQYSALGLCLQQLLELAGGSSPEAYYASRAYGSLATQLISAHGLSQSHIAEMSANITNLRRSEDLLRIAPFVVSHQDFISNVPASKNWFNAVVAEATGLNYDQQREQALRKLVLLNIFLTTMDESFIASAAQQRLVFLFRDTIKGLEQTMADPVLQTVMLSVLTKLCEPLQQVYGDYWESLIGYIKALWTDCPSLVSDDLQSAQLNRVFESQRLYRALRRVSKLEDCNEDLTDALSAASSDLETGLLHLLSVDIAQDDEFNQPLRMVRDSVANELRKTSSQLEFDPESLYPVVHAQNEALQICAFQLLHQRLPHMQVQTSLDVAIEKTSASIPDTLLSLTLDAPQDIEIGDLEDLTTQLAVKRYLYAWVLVFDHFTNSSHQVQLLYMDSIKTSGDLTALLDFVYALLSQAKVLTAKTLPYNVTSFDVASADTPKQEILWLLCHIYYLSLVHTSSLTKAWWLNSHRTVASNMETWTERHITPHVMARAFTEVENWSKDQESGAGADDKSLTIKANKSSREVIASYVVGGEDDERFVSICVSLPSTFPLRAASVLSRTATSAFEARKWQSWLMIAQGTITFNNNSIPDGLLAWRRNITGALQGKSECTICYSLVSEDGKLPNKECKTCKHAFHMLCLTKWFASSGDKKCPLCRSDFVGLGRVDRSGRRNARED